MGDPEIDVGEMPRVLATVVDATEIAAPVSTTAINGWLLKSTGFWMRFLCNTIGADSKVGVVVDVLLCSTSSVDGRALGGFRLGQYVAT